MYYIKFLDGSLKCVTDERGEQIIAESFKPNSKNFLLDNQAYNFSSISKILLEKEYYEQYPDQIPVQTRNTFLEIDKPHQPLTKNRYLRILKDRIRAFEQYIASPLYKGTKAPHEILKATKKKILEVEKQAEESFDTTLDPYQIAEKVITEFGF